MKGWLNLINWKKEGFKINDDVFLVIKGLFDNTEKYYKGKVSYIGTKILKVRIQEKEVFKEIKFNGTKNKRSFDEVYIVYKSLNEYVELTKKEKNKTELKNSIINKLEIE